MIHSFPITRSFRIDHIDQLHFISNIEMWIVYVCIEWFDLFFTKVSKFYRFICNFHYCIDGIEKRDSLYVDMSKGRKMFCGKIKPKKQEKKIISIKSSKLEPITQYLSLLSWFLISLFLYLEGCSLCKIYFGENDSERWILFSIIFSFFSIFERVYEVVSSVISSSDSFFSFSGGS